MITYGKTDYKICTAEYPMDLEAEVRALMAKGWTVAGPLIYTQNLSMRFVQPMQLIPQDTLRNL